MMSGIKTIIFPVKDIGQATALYGTLLGAEPVMNEPYYVQFNVAGHEIGLDPEGHNKGMTGPVVYWQVDDIEESLRQLLDAGARPKQEVTDVGGGKRFIASVTDADGNVIALIQAA